MTPREAAIEGFLQGGAWKGARRLPFAHDASFRRYFRLAGGPRPALLMDGHGAGSRATSTGWAFPRRRSTRPTRRRGCS